MFFFTDPIYIYIYDILDGMQACIVLLYTFIELFGLVLVLPQKLIDPTT